MQRQLAKVAVVGANGFIGRSLIEYLDKSGIDTVKIFSDQLFLLNPEFESILSEVSSVIWCASRVNPISAEANPDLINVELAEWNSFLDGWINRFGSKKSVIFLSSGGCTYSGDELPFNEESVANGINKYGELKISMEKELMSRETPSLILRVANVYGPNQPHGRGQGVIAEWKKAIESNQNIKVFGSIKSFRDYIFIDDLCEAILCSLEHSNQSQILNLGGGVPVSLDNILEVLQTLKIDRSSIEFYEKRTSDRDGYYLDITKFKTLTNWEPKFSIRDGLQKTIEI